MASLFVIVPGFGEGNVPEKVRILENNVRIISEGPWTFKMRIVVYTPGLQMPDFVESDPRIEIVRREGCVGENLRRFAHPRDIVGRYDLVLMLLDDVELHGSVDWAQMLEDKRALGLDVISPSLTHQSAPGHPYMFAKRDSIEDYNVTNFLEFFCYLMDSEAYMKYYVHLDPDNPWMWGVDLVLHTKGGLRTALANRMTMTHHFKGTAYAESRPYEDMVLYLKKYGYDLADIQSIPPIKYLVFNSVLGSGRKLG
jgi:hypothetical protein